MVKKNFVRVPPLKIISGKNGGGWGSIFLFKENPHPPFPYFSSNPYGSSKLSFEKETKTKY